MKKFTRRTRLGALRTGDIFRVEEQDEHIFEVLLRQYTPRNIVVYSMVGGDGKILTSSGLDRIFIHKVKQAKNAI